MNGGNCRPNPIYIICYKSVPAQLKRAWYYFFYPRLRCLVVLSSSQRLKESLNESLAFQAPLFKLNNYIYIDIPPSKTHTKPCSPCWNWLPQMLVYFGVLVAVHPLRPKNVCWGFTRRHLQQQPRRLHSLPIFTLSSPHRKHALHSESSDTAILGLRRWLIRIAQWKRLVESRRSFYTATYMIHYARVPAFLNVKWHWINYSK